MPFGCWFPLVKPGMRVDAAVEPSKRLLRRMLLEKGMLTVGARLTVPRGDSGRG